MGGKYTNAQKAAAIKYIANKTESIQLRVPKGKKDEYHKFAKSQGKSLNKLVQDLLDNAMKTNKKP